MSWAIARTVIGIIGNVTSSFLFGWPIPTFYRNCKNKAVEDQFKSDPYIGAMIPCIFWIFYGIITPNSTLVVTINSIGLFLELVYLAILLYFSNQQRRNNICLLLLATVAVHAFIACVALLAIDSQSIRSILVAVFSVVFVVLGLLLCGSPLTIMRNICVLILAEVAVHAVIACVALIAIDSQSKRSILVGVLSVVFGLLLYGSPLTIMKKVIDTKSVEYMPLWPSVAGFSNGVIWAAYALIKVPPTMRIDWYILTANGLAAICAAAQLVLYAMYFGSTPKSKTSDDDPKKPKKM